MRLAGRACCLFVVVAIASSPAPAGTMADPICTDRPGKGSATCTVPNGHFQFETSLAHWSLTKTAGQRDTRLTLGDSAIKYGVTDRLHIEVAMPLLVRKRTRTEGGTSRDSGPGDVKLKVKQEISLPVAGLSAAFYPFVKLPTASKRIGNGKVEGGVIVPLSLALGEGGWSLSASPELDATLDGDGHGYHATMVHQASLGFQATKALNLSAELWGSWDWDPAGTTRQASLDGSVAYRLTSELQIDGGVNWGLNRNTADVEIYGGVSARF